MLGTKLIQLLLLFCYSSQPVWSVVVELGSGSLQNPALQEFEFGEGTQGYFFEDEFLDNCLVTDYNFTEGVGDLTWTVLCDVGCTADCSLGGCDYQDTDEGSEFLNYTNTTENTASDTCVCNVYKHSSVLRCSPNGVDYHNETEFDLQNYLIISDLPFNYTTFVLSMDPHQHSVFNELSTRRSSGDNSATLNEHTVYVTAVDPGYATIEFLGKLLTVVVYHETVEVELNPGDHDKAGTVIVLIYSQDGLVYTKLLIHKANAPCIPYEIDDYRYLQHRSCATVGKMVGFFFLWIMVGSLSLAFIYKTFKPFVMLLWWIWCFLSRFLGFCNNCRKYTILRTTEKMANVSDVMAEAVSSSPNLETGPAEQVFIPVSADYMAPRRYNGLKIRGMACILIVCVSGVNSDVPLQEACGRTQVIETSIATCSRASDLLNCPVNINGNIRMPIKGTTACIDYRDTDDKTVLGRLVIEYEDFFVSNDLEFAYWTSAFSGIYQCVHRCPGAKDSQCTEGCSTVKWNDTNPLNQLNQPDVINWPGISSCHRGCGCSTCDGCFSCEASCNNCKATLKPTGTPYACYGISTSASVVPHIKAYIVDAVSSTVIFDGVWLSTIPTEVSGFLMSVSGIFNIETLTFPGKGVCKGGPWKLLMPMSEVGRPEKFKAGDNQADTQASYSSPHNSAFIFDPNIITSTTGSLGATYIFAKPGLTIQPTAVLPSPYQGVVLSENEGKLYYSYNKSAPIDIGFESLGTIQLQRYVLPVCPKITEVVTASSCYDCAKGGIVIIKAYSDADCSSGNVMISADEDYIILDTESARIENDPLDPQLLHISFRTTSESNDFNLCLHDDQRKDCVRVQFLAQLDHEPLIPPIIDGDDVGVPRDVKDDLWSRFVRFITSPFKIIMTVISIVAFSVVVYFACGMIPKGKTS